MATSVARLPGRFRITKPSADPPLRCACARSCPNSHASWRQRFAGVWALTDNANNLFNVRLSADGSAG